MSKNVSTRDWCEDPYIQGGFSVDYLETVARSHHAGEEMFEFVVVEAVKC